MVSAGRQCGARRLRGGLLDEFLTCLARKSRVVAFRERSFAASWKAFECAQRIVNRLRARVEIGNRLANRSARDASQHLRVGREFFHEHQQSLNCFLWLVSGQTASDEIDFLQLPLL